MKREYGTACCICKHFRMWKPEPEFCTIKKERVDPLKENESCFELRKGLALVTGGRT